jgi:nucleoside-diphosphate-sugar epimerase
MHSDCEFPLNLGSERMISINNLALLIGNIVGKNVNVKNVPGPTGVMARTSHNKFIEQHTGWKPNEDLETGLKHTYDWIKKQIASINHVRKHT